MPPTLILASGSVIWGLTWIWLKHIHALGLEPITTSVIAYGAQMLLILPFAIAQLRQVHLRRRIANDRIGRWLLLLAVVGGISGIGFTMAITYGNVVRSMMLFFLIPAWGVLFGHWFLREVITPIRMLAVGLALGGAAIILGPDAIASTPLNIADLAALIAGITLAASNVLFLYMADQPFVLKLGSMQLGTVVIGLLALLTIHGVPAHLPAAGVLNSVGYGTTMLLAAILASQYAVERLPAGRAAILMTLELLVAVFSAIVIGHERPLPHVWVGGALILAATLIEAFHKVRHENQLPSGA